MKTTQRVFLLLFSAILLSPGLLAQTAPVAVEEGNPFSKSDFWAVGLQAGVLSGSGLGVRYHPRGSFAAQFVGVGIRIGDVTTYNFGAEGQFDLDNNGRSRFYTYLGTGVYSWSNEGEEKLEGQWRLGLGIAYEWSVSAKLIFGANGAITYFSDGTILPLPQIGLFYYFN